MRILGIETSCDETAVAIVKTDGLNFEIEKNIILSQIQTHRKYGGVVPEVAAREHVKALPEIIINEIDATGQDIDLVAVTVGPGLSPALRIGVAGAQTLAWLWNKPLVAVNHLKGHIFSNWIGEKKPEFPSLCLLVSGGHTELILVKSFNDFEKLGETLDDAVGEAFDKVASMLGLQYPGGPEIARLAEGGENNAFDFPRGMLNRPNLDFSFSGIKTSVLYTLRKNEERLGDEKFRADIASSFQEAVVDVLVKKTLRAIKQFSPKSVLLAGGVASNKVLRDRLKNEIGDKMFLPDLKYTTDNAVMIAVAGYFKAIQGGSNIKPEDIILNSNLDF